MGETICGTIEQLLASVQDQIDDTAVSYRVRTARQLAVACQYNHERAEETLAEADLDQETVEQLREYGYLP